jgi:S-DNA-T family DNA segregation ATPase FtsK/SpoIIIE
VGVTIVKRAPYRRPPVLPSGDVVLEAPPEVPDETGQAWARILMFLPMAAGTAAMGLLLGGTRGGPLAYIAGGMYGISVLGMIAAQIAMTATGQKKRDMAAARRQYLKRLSQLRADVHETIRQQREALFYRHPDPDTLWNTVASTRLWERRVTHPDFAVVRIGTGSHELATPLVPPETPPVDDLEPLCATALRRFVTTYSVVPDLPVAVALRGFSRVYLRGPRHRCRELINAIIAQAAAVHAPDDMVIAFCVSPDIRPAWDWVKWLPHALHPTKTDAAGQLRLVASSIPALEAMLDDLAATWPRFDADAPPRAGMHLIVVVDGGDTAGSDHLMAEGGIEGVTIIDLDTPPPRLLDRASLVLTLTDETMVSTTAEGESTIGRADQLSAVQAEALARQLAPLRLSQASARDDQPLSSEIGLAELLGIDDPYTFEPRQLWAARPSRDRLRVPIGVGPDGRPVELDLKESAQDGMGPHGLLVGATGSGKSELLRTLVLALAATHSSETLNLVLIDFKGGATFSKLDRLPHTSAVITNLAEQLPLVDRMLDALSGELVRRQELLRDAGSYASQRDYERARAAGAPLEPLPSLLVICDEFSELLSAKPDFIDMFVQIGRVGRSLGIHLLLASQRLEEGRLRGLETHLSYRISLRTFSSAESRVVLGVPDAYHLPRSPGNGYLKAGTEALRRFRGAYVSGHHRRDDGHGRELNEATAALVQPYDSHYQAPATVAEAEPTRPADDDDPADAFRETLLDILVDRLAQAGPPAHQIWLPPLSDPPALNQLLPGLVRDPQRGLTVSVPEMRGSLRGVVGLVDRPFEQRRDVLVVDLSGAGGNVAVVGAPRSGKSTLLRTLIGGLAVTHTPAEAQFYCLDLAGGGLAPLRDLPHVGGVASRLEPERVRRTVAEVAGILRDRERSFTRLGIDSITTYRALRADGRISDDPYGDVLLVIDGWATLRSEFASLETTVVDLATRGLGFGVHVILTCTRWLDLRTNVRDLFATRLELRLGDASDSMVNRRVALNVPADTPGRGLTPDGFHFLAGLPRIDGRSDVESLAEATSDFVTTVAQGWSGPVAPPVRMLPTLVPYAQLPGPTDQEQPGLPLGLSELDLRPVYLDPSAEPFLLIFGDVESGKTAALRVLARAIADRYPPDQARIIVVDYRRGLLGSVSGQHLLAYGSNASVTEGIMRDVVAAMRERLPGPDVTPEQLRDRSWWRGPDLYLLVDDYDLVSGAGTNPLAPLVEFAAQARDIGLHIVVTRRTGGAARALYDPLIGRMRELAAAGIVMSGSKEEGVLLGNIRPQPLPPGRGWLVTRRDGSRLVQLAWLAPDAGTAD